jgi:hypothetical protein
MFVSRKFPGALIGLASLLLGGCAANNYWKPDAEWYDFKPTEITLLQVEDPSAICGFAANSILGCTLMRHAISQCTVLLKARLPVQASSCIVTHELRHCFGDFHYAFDKMTHYSIDCGDGEFYLGPAQAEG